MYIPPKFHLDEDLAWQVVSEAGAGVLVLAAPTGLASVFVPVVVSEDRRTITAHIAKANPWWKAVKPGSEVLAIFLSASAYESASYYPSRLEDPNVVPTWDYVAAEVRGRAQVHEETEWKFDQVHSLVQRFEHGRNPEWRIEDAPRDYIDEELKEIVGLEIKVTSIEGKAKLSQNCSDQDRCSVREHLASGSLGERNVALHMKTDE
jgi:transcriptional regulator